MARKLRIQYPGAIYHVMNRGDRREAIFEDDPDRGRLLETLTEACERTNAVPTARGRRCRLKFLSFNCVGRMLSA